MKRHPKEVQKLIDEGKLFPASEDWRLVFLKEYCAKCKRNTTTTYWPLSSGIVARVCSVCRACRGYATEDQYKRWKELKARMAEGGCDEQE